MQHQILPYADSNIYEMAKGKKGYLKGVENVVVLLKKII